MWTFDFGCVDVRFWLFGNWILVVLTFDFGCLVVLFWLGVCQVLWTLDFVVLTLDFGC